MAPTRARTLPLHPMPFVRIELAVLSVIGASLHVLLGRRTEEPAAGRWALPGGVIRIDLDSERDLDAACRRVARERLGIELPGATQLLAVGGRGRDPRAPWTLSVVYLCTVPGGQLAAEPGKRLEELKWTVAEQAAADARMAFDHGRIVGRAVQALRAEVAALRFAPGLLTETFTLGELQAVSEAVLGHALDKSSFRRRVDAGEVVAAVPGQMRTGAFRPAQVFRLR